jgi:HSP20 family protein
MKEEHSQNIEDASALETEAAVRLGMGKSFRVPHVNVNVSETDDDILVSADVPGLASGDIMIEIRGNTLTMTGNIPSEIREEDTQRRFLRCERSSGEFSRHVVLPSAVNEDTIGAVVENGVLFISLQKRMDEGSRKRIPIREE